MRLRASGHRQNLEGINCHTVWTDTTKTGTKYHSISRHTPHRPVQAEVLVPNQIPLDYVERVVFVSEASFMEGKRLWGLSTHPQFEVAPECFADNPGQPSPIGYAYLERLILTDVSVNENNVYQPFSPRLRFHRILGGRITAVAYLYAPAGTQARVRWDPIGLEVTTEFQTSSYYWHWPSISIDGLLDSECIVEYYINNILWIRLNFELTTL
ncbi:MAG: DUF4433 domain-containing protein [Acidobacteria bacterium]|nr:DUF4433 domain-containing protein [Acidobacteriota bacterium]